MPPPLCIPVPGQDWGNADAGLIQDGINYLSGLQGGCCVGPTSCVRISCSWNSAIFLCNDNGYTICPNCGYLATYASDMINDCSSWNGGDSIIVGGQLFDSDHYNIIVRWDSC
ncbi:uncharacterized protein LY89DRAFT_598214 [Mollisia scopiformis]|uniref:Uncharacterized protein n=1 Tax=Mollisia scopiformis TaxID=149040 RepID=A0A132B9Z3_MOLSC|nr:uncharacterized protein LY89DRAFT_598214 [Mollisia scopiformis]KUJ09226.1 hypothetical protein LY89DRAFT_598214 [Mollisia scopiformis]